MLLFCPYVLIDQVIYNILVVHNRFPCDGFPLDAGARLLGFALILTQEHRDVRLTVGVSVHPKGVRLASVLDSEQACQGSLNIFFYDNFLCAHEHCDPGTQNQTPRWEARLGKVLTNSTIRFIQPVLGQFNGCVSPCLTCWLELA